MKIDNNDFLVYAVTDRHWLGEETLAMQVEKALKGGATFIQLREKTLDEEAFMAEAIEIQALCRKYGVPFVINDNVAIAKAMDADGVHVGQKDMEAGDVRAILGPDKIIGVSTANVAEAIKAQECGADYIGCGAVFSTNTKADTRDVDYDTLKAVCDAVDIPVVAIGGITRDNIVQLAGTGIDGVAVISAIFGQEDIEEATRDLKKQTKQIVG